MVEAQEVREDFENRIPLAEYLMDVQNFIIAAADLGFNHVDFYVYAEQEELLREIVDDCVDSGYMVQIDHNTKDYDHIMSARLKKITLNW